MTKFFCFILKLKIMKQNHACSAYKCSLLPLVFLSFIGVYPGQFLKMYVYILLFYIMSSLTYFHIEIFAPYLNVLHAFLIWTQTILGVKLIRSLCHWHNSKPFRSWKTDSPRGILRTQSNIYDWAFSKFSLWLKSINYFCKMLHLRC